MKNHLSILCLAFLLLCCRNTSEKTIDNTDTTVKATTETETKSKFAIIIHGGAGSIKKENFSEDREKAYREKLEEAIRAGYDILEKGGSSLDAVQKSINIMEDSPLFNAGKGAVFTNAETNELDASIMDGKTLNAGASTGTTTVKNPINLARAIMDNSPHVMMAGSGAELFAEERGLELVDPKYFQTEKAFKSLERVKDAEIKKIMEPDRRVYYDNTIKGTKYGTVGCAALDKDGNLAAGTSTGGMTNKRYGRVGDAPIIGAGTYANNNSCAVSGTGWGEYFIRGMVAHDISAMMQYQKVSLKEAAKEVIQKKNPELGGNGGVIAVDNNGNMVAEFNTPGMFRATMNDKGELEIAMFKAR